MTTDPFSALSYGALFQTPTARDLLSEESRIRAMLRFEAALARVEARHGIIPKKAGRLIDKTLKGVVIDPAALATSADAAGVPVPALISEIRKTLPEDVAHYVHWGATSQDVIDTALVLVLADAVSHFDQRLRTLIARLAALARRHRATVMLARTRLQQAAPTTFGLKVAGWRAPLIRARARLSELKPRLLALQFGGASGTLAPLGEAAAAVHDDLARELGLVAPAMPWHTQRDAIVEFAAWLALTAGSLGKIGLDVGLLAQSEVAEVRESADRSRGGSSTLPQKSNPVLSETMVALARYCAGALANMQNAMLVENERGGAGWALEWLTLPNMIVAADAALSHALAIAEELIVDAGRMRENFEASRDLALAEAAAFALARHMPRHEAQAMVRDAAFEAIKTGVGLIEILQGRTDRPIDWAHLSRPENHLGAADAFTDRAIGDDGQDKAK